MSLTETDHPNGPAADADTLILNHQPGLFILFFTEMWERFSYYGMRALLVLFLTAELLNQGWGWGRADALRLYAFYTGLVYVTPIFGGLLADMLFGYRRAVILGALLMTLGHASIALETVWGFYAGLLGLILGNGLFKPNISSIVGQLYEREKEKRDAAYTIFYMGINAGAFLGILLCGYIGEKVGWSYGFGLAGIFMLLGMLQFYFAQSIFGQIGLPPRRQRSDDPHTADTDGAPDTQKTGVTVAAAAAVRQATTVTPEVERDRIIVISVFAFFTIFFWWAFEQAGGSMTIFAEAYTNRVLVGGYAMSFNIVNMLLTVVPMCVVTWVLLRLFSGTFGKYLVSNLFLGLSFLIIWAIAIWLIQNDFRSRSYTIEYQDFGGSARETRIRTTSRFAPGDLVPIRRQLSYRIYDPPQGSDDHLLRNGYIYDDEGQVLGPALQASIESIRSEKQKGLFWRDSLLAELKVPDSRGPSPSKPGATISLRVDGLPKQVGDTVTLRVVEVLSQAGALGTSDLQAKVIGVEDQEVEVPASWFGILNSFFIIVFAPFFSRAWERNLIRSGAIKFALGLILLGLGFAILAFGASSIPAGAKVAQVSMIWLILAYLLHTLGELCISPVGLSYVSKLAPLRLVGVMFGIWFLATFVANFAAGFTGSYIDTIAEQYSLSAFFLIFTVIPVAAGIVMIGLNGWMQQKMHGVE